MFIELQKAFSRIAVKESEIVKFRTCVYSEDTEIFFKCRDGKNVCSETVNERYNTMATLLSDPLIEELKKLETTECFIVLAKRFLVFSGKEVFRPDIVVYIRPEEILSVESCDDGGTKIRLCGDYNGQPCEYVEDDYDSVLEKLSKVCGVYTLRDRELPVE